MSKYLLSLFFILGCGKFNYSPYISKTDNVNHNKKSLLKIESRAASFGSDYKVALISDTHDYYEELKQIVKYINRHKSEYAFVIVTGDITNIGLLREFEVAKEYLDDLDVPYVITIGNHDLLTNGGDIFSNMFGSHTFAFVFKQTKFILYNNNNWESSYEVPQLNWIESELTSSTSTHIVMASHVSVDDDARYSSKERTDFMNLTDSYSVKYQVNGHDHNQGESSFGNSTRVTIGSPSKNVFCELIITNSGVNHAFVNP